MIICILIHDLGSSYAWHVTAKYFCPAAGVPPVYNDMHLGASLLIYDDASIVNMCITVYTHLYCNIY